MEWHDVAEYVTDRLDPVASELRRLVDAFDQHRREHVKVESRHREQQRSARLAQWAIAIGAISAIAACVAAIAPLLQ